MATLKRKKSDGTWETVATPSDFPVQIPVEIVDADLTTLSVTQNGTYNPSPHDGYSSVTVNVPSGPTAQIKTGSATSNRTTATVNCGFNPDVVFFYTGDVTGFHYYCGVAFTQYTSNVATIYNFDGTELYSAIFDRTTNGFSFRGTNMASQAQSLTINYTAVRYT